MKNYILFFLAIISISFISDKSKSTYTIPMAAWSVTAGDIDMDGDNDIIVGHNYNSTTEWSGVSIMLNDGNGYFSLFDSVFLYSGQSSILLENLNTEPNKEIIAYHYNQQVENEFLAIINNFELDNVSYTSLNTNEGVSYKSIGDIDGDGNKDIVLSSHSGHFWGILYSDGQGNFSEPEYHNLTYPKDVTCGKLNNDERDDIVVCGPDAKVYFSYESGFETLELEGSDAAIIIDFDLDGINDILSYAGVWDNTFLNNYKNIGNNEFEILEQKHFLFNSTKMIIEDFNNDSFPDILLELLDHTGYYLFYNQGDFQLSEGQFVSLPPAIPEEPWRDSYCAEMDGNGYIDIIAVKTSYIFLADNLEILFNDGNGHFLNDPITNVADNISNKQNRSINAHPNPFSNHISIEVIAKKNCHLDLFIYDLKGNLIWNKNHLEASEGKQVLSWNGKDRQGNSCVNGIYLLEIFKNGEFLESMKIVKSN